MAVKLDDITKMTADQELAFTKKLNTEYITAFTSVTQDLESFVAKHGIDTATMSPAIMRQGKRLESLQSQIGVSLASLNASIKPKLVDHLAEVYEKNYYGAGFALEKAGKIDLAYSKLDKDAIKRSILTDYDNIALKDNAEQVRKRIATSVNQAVIRGESVQKLSQRIKADLEMNGNKAVRIARTSTTRVMGSSRLDSFNHAAESGLELKKIWVSTNDMRTRSSHAALDGEEVALDEDFSIGVSYPSDPFGDPAETINCRCTMITDIASGYGNMPAPEGDLDDWIDNLVNKTDKPIPQKKMSLKQEVAAIKQAYASSRTIPIAEVRGVGAKIMANLQKSKKPILTEIAKAEKDIAKLSHLDKKYAELTAKRQDLEAGIRGLKTPKELGFKNVQELETAYDAARVAHRELANSDDFGKLMDMRTQLRLTKSKLRGDMDDNRMDFRIQMEKIRPMGLDMKMLKDLEKHMGPDKTDSAKAVKAAYHGYPTEWIKKSMAYDELDVGYNQRGYYSHGSTSTMSGRVFPSVMKISGHSPNSRLETATHEVGHRMERVIDKMKAMEKEFYESRTQGEKLQWLGGSYAKSEQSRFDKFLDTYMGKDYSGVAYELNSMGFDWVMNNPTKLWEDKEYAEWIYGQLALL